MFYSLNRRDISYYKIIHVCLFAFKWLLLFGDYEMAFRVAPLIAPPVPPTPPLTKIYLYLNYRKLIRNLILRLLYVLTNLIIPDPWLLYSSTILSPIPPMKFTSQNYNKCLSNLMTNQKSKFNDISVTDPGGNHFYGTLVRVLECYIS